MYREKEDPSPTGNNSASTIIFTPPFNQSITSDLPPGAPTANTFFILRNLASFLLCTKFTFFFSLSNRTFFLFLLRNQQRHKNKTVTYLFFVEFL
jgi:hypothetical protein